MIVREIPAGKTLNIPGDVNASGSVVHGKSVVVPGGFTVRDGGTLHIHPGGVFLVIKVNGIGLVVEPGGVVINNGEIIEINPLDQMDAIEHGGLTGLTNDDHPHYLTNERGDGRYPIKTQTISRPDYNWDGDTRVDISTRAWWSWGGESTLPAYIQFLSTYTSGIGCPLGILRILFSGAKTKSYWTPYPIPEHKTLIGLELNSLGGGYLFGKTIAHTGNLAQLIEDVNVQHSSLVGLGDDDHPQYLTSGRGDGRYSLLSHNHDHSLLTGLGDDDHPQYFNSTRGDVRYVMKGYPNPNTGAVEIYASDDFRFFIDDGFGDPGCMTFDGLNIYLDKRNAGGPSSIRVVDTWNINEIRTNTTWVNLNADFTHIGFTPGTGCFLKATKILGRIIFHIKVVGTFEGRGNYQGSTDMNLVALLPEYKPSAPTQTATRWLLGTHTNYQSGIQFVDFRLEKDSNGTYFYMRWYGVYNYAANFEMQLEVM